MFFSREVIVPVYKCIPTLQVLEYVGIELRHNSNEFFLCLCRQIGWRFHIDSASNRKIPLFALLAVASLVTIRKAQFGTYSWATLESHDRPLIILDYILNLYVRNKCKRFCRCVIPQRYQSSVPVFSYLSVYIIQEEFHTSKVWNEM